MVQDEQSTIASQNSLTNGAVNASPPGPGLGQAINYALIILVVALVCVALLHLIGLGGGVLSSDECWYIGYAAGLVFVLRRVIRNSKGTWRSYFPARRVGVLEVALAIVGVLVIKLAIVALVRLLPFYEHTKKTPGDLDATVLNLILVCVFGPVCEELFFRGWVFFGFRARYSPARAILLSATLFAVVHVHPYAMIQTFASGCFYAWLVKKTGSLVPAIAAHAANNTVVTLAGLYG